MTIGFIDVPPGTENYDEIMEAANTFLSDGNAILDPIPYQVFEKNKPFIYYDMKAKKNQLTYTIPYKISPTEDVPLFVYVDGVSWGYKESKIVGNNTEIHLYVAPKSGAVVSFCSYGEPTIVDHKPYLKTIPYYASHGLQYRDKYIFWPYYGNQEIVTVMGRRLKRVVIDPIDLATGLTDQQLARKYIGDKSDVYMIPPSGHIHMPGTLTGVTATITYAYNTKGKTVTPIKSIVKHVTETFKAALSGYLPYRYDRFFPDIAITRADMITALDRLREHFITRLTDKDVPTTIINDNIIAYAGQKVFRLNGYYPSGKGVIKVFKRLVKGDPNSNYAYLVRGRDYQEFDNHTILLNEPGEEGFYYGFYYEKRISERFNDVGRNTKVYDRDNKKLYSIDGTTADWVKHVLAMESDTMKDGTHVIFGSNVSSFHDSTHTIPNVDEWGHLVPGSSPRKPYFLPQYMVLNEQTATVLNRFRKWCIERLT